MKEFTIEEKARRYDEAYKKVAVRFGSNVADEIFPELKESEDERIRQELIAIYSVGARGNMKTGDIPDKDIVAWLEKQGEKPQGKTALESIKEEKVENTLESKV